VKRSDIPKRIQLSSKKKTVIGWNTWLSSQSNSYLNNETLDIKISANRIN
jgi:hypothetical protein